MKFINVNFEVSSDMSLKSQSNKDYVFKCDITGLQEGDLVVCETSRGYGIGIVIGEEFKATRIKMANAWIVEKVDMDSHKKRLELEKKKIEIKNKMEERKKLLEDEAVYTLLAKEDEAMADLLKQFKEL